MEKRGVRLPFPEKTLEFETSVPNSVSTTVMRETTGSTTESNSVRRGVGYGSGDRYPGQVVILNRFITSETPDVIKVLMNLWVSLNREVPFQT